MSSAIGVFVDRILEPFTQCYPDRKELSNGGMFFLFALFCVYVFALPLEPQDDLLRHLKAYLYNYDYRLLYPFSPGVPSFNIYYLFDVAVGHLHRLAGNYSYSVLQVIAVSLYFCGIFWLLKGTESNNLRFLITIATVVFCIGRLSLARPATFESGLFLIALAACRDEEFRPGIWFHLLMGGLMISFYHLFWIYLIPLVLYRRVYLVSIITGVGAWATYGGAEYLAVLKQIFILKGTRGINISEAASLINQTGIHPYLVLCAGLLVPVIYYWRRDTKQLLMVAWFLMANQIRYMESIIPLITSYSRYWNIRISQGVCLLIFCSLCIVRPVTREDDSWRQLENIVPAGSKVICLDMGTMFKAVYANNRIMAAPSMEAGWDAPETVEAMKYYLEKREVRPGSLKGFDYLIEDKLKEPPKGFSLYKISGRYRVWRINHV